MACPEGATCPGGNRVWPNDGYWTPDEHAGYVVKCTLPLACNSFGCREGYEGYACGSCQDGYFIILTFFFFLLHAIAARLSFSFQSMNFLL